MASINLRKRGVWLGVAIFAGAMALVAGVFAVAHSQRQFELDRWEAKLRTGAAPSVARTAQWLADSRSQLRAVSVNPTVQMFLSEAAVPTTGLTPAPETQAQAMFLASYIASLSARGAFAADAGHGALGAPSTSGLAVLDAHRHIVAATFGYRPSRTVVMALLGALKNGSAGPLLSQSRAVFAVAVQPMQGTAAAPIGYVIGERALGPAFWGTGSAATVEGGHESLVAIGSNASATLIGASVAPKSPPAHAGELDAVRQPLHLEAAPDFAGRDALHVAVPVTGAPWFVVETVPASSALAGVDDRIRALVLILLLALLAIIAAILALWRHNAGLRAVEAREESVQLYRGVVALLLQAIDLRDPGAAAHSRRVAALARAMALNMGMSEQDADTVELAGALLNVGKLFVPADLLTKTGPLDDADRHKFDAGSARWLDLLAQVSFDPRLEPILRSAQALMHADRNAAAIAPREAQIIMAANAAVALMSRRAWRPAHSAAEALQLLGEPPSTLPTLVLDSLRQALASPAFNRVP